MKGILTAAQIIGYNRKRDKSVSLRFETQEKSSNEIALIDSILDTFGYLYFKPEETLTKEEISELDNLDTELYDNPKTQSQRLRNVLFKYHEQIETDISFKDFYKLETEKIISHYKKKLEP